MIFMCISQTSFASQNVLIGKENITLPDIKGYTIHVHSTSSMFSKVKECISICGSTNNIVALYLSNAYDTDMTIENCMEIDFLSIMDNGSEVAPGADNTAILERIIIQTNLDTAKKKLFSEIEKCTKAQSVRAGGIFRFKSAEFVNSLRGENYVVFIMKNQIEKRVGDEWKPIVSYDAMANVILKGRILTINASDTHRQTTPEAAKEIVLHLINALNAANK